MDNGQYFTGGYVTRVCNAEGEWIPPDYSNCKVKGNTGSFALIWMTFLTSSGTVVLSRLSYIVEDVSKTQTKLIQDICSTIIIVTIVSHFIMISNLSKTIAGLGLLMKL